MKSNSTLNEITISSNFIKSTYFIESKEELLNKIYEFADRFNYSREMTVYYFIKQCLKEETYQRFKRDIIDEVYYIAAIWASKEETIQKVRPKSFHDVKKKKHQLVFTKLYIDTINYIDSQYKIGSTERAIELELYISLLNNLACIKRISTKNN
jgi:hypothetical protein